MEFHIADYVVLATFLAISAAIGFFVAFKQRGQRSTSEYLLGGEQHQHLYQFNSFEQSVAFFFFFFFDGF